MKNSLSYMLIGLLAIYVVILTIQSNQQQAQIDEMSNQGKVELVNQMSKFQYFSNKLWFAGKSGNWELAHFYAHEIEETIEIIEEANLTEEGQDVTTLLDQMLEPQFESIEKAINEKDSMLFKDNYTAFINSCNACHMITKHDFIKIQLPTKPVIDSQVY